MVLHVHIQSNLKINFIIHVCKANLVDFMMQPVHIKTNALSNVFPPKFLVCKMSRKILQTGVSQVISLIEIPESWQV